jgi:hypothetical protein
VFTFSTADIIVKRNWMKRRFLLALLLVFLGFTLLAPIGMTLNTEPDTPGNYERTFTFDAEQGSSHATYTLYTSVPPSLYDYYRGKPNSVNSDREYSKFVTPEPVQTLADNIRNISSSDEEFANNVLALVHQIPYAVSNIKYPVEAIAENSGDCDVLSFLAASIMKAGGLDVVLLVYRDLHPAHMNIGVYLPYTPVYDKLETAATGFEYNNKTYWAAECTPTGNWKVGYQPDCFAPSAPVVIHVDTREESSSARVSSSLNKPLLPSSISVTLSLENMNGDNGWAVMISGSISPSYSGKEIVLYVSRDGGYSYTVLQTVTDSFGNYSIPCNVPSSGTYKIRTSLIGFSNYAGSDSETVTVFVSPSPTPDVANVAAYQQSNESKAAFAYNGNAEYQLGSQSNSAFLKSKLTGTNISLSGDFLILNGGENSTNSGQTITLPETTQTIIRYRRRSIVVTIPERTIKIQEPENNQFGFILENDDGNYSASVKLLDGADVSNIEKRIDGSNATFMNVSRSIERNVWYKAVAKISGDEITTELRGENDTLIETSVIKSDAIDMSKFGIVLSCNPSTFIAFKNLKVESLDQQPNALVDMPLPENELESLVPYILPVVLLVMACSAIYFHRKNRKSQSPSKIE